MTANIPAAKAPTGENFTYHLRAPNEDLISYVTHLASQGDIVRVGPGGRFAIYFVNHPDYVQQILVTQAKMFHKPTAIKKAVSNLLGTANVFSSDDDVWRALRKAVSPAFHMQRISSYLAMIADMAGGMVAGWQDGQTLDVPAAMMDLTMGVTSRTLFDIDLRDQKAGAAIIRFIERFNERITSPVPPPLWLPTQANREIKATLQIADDLILPIIAERRASGEDKGDVLSMLLIAQQNDESGILTDAQVAVEIQNLFAAGYEGTAHATAFALYFIAQHPAVEEKLLAEVDKATQGKPLTMDALQQMSYLQQVLNESMRLLPVTMVLGRQAIAEVQLGQYSLPQGAQVLISPWTLHRRQDIFPQPETFDPQRFAEGNDIPKHAYIPFSTGPRICLGNAFAELQMKATLATILQRYTLRLPADYTLKPVWRFNTRPEGALPMTLQAR